jgi:hypothetical protein
MAAVRNMIEPVTTVLVRGTNCQMMVAQQHGCFGRCHDLGWNALAH